MSSSSFLEQKMQEMESRHVEELETLREEKGSLQALVGKQSGVIGELETQLSQATGNSTALQRQQQDMMNTVHNLLNLCSKDGGRVAWSKVRNTHMYSQFMLSQEQGVSQTNTINLPPYWKT